MQATGIIAEYNPFHNGHLYHIQETKRLTQQPVIVVMSGSFMQHALPAALKLRQGCVSFCKAAAAMHRPGKKF